MKTILFSIIIISCIGRQGDQIFYKAKELGTEQQLTYVASNDTVRIGDTLCFPMTIKQH